MTRPAPDRRPWAEDETKRLKAYMLEMDCGLISQVNVAKALNRTIGSVANKVCQLRGAATFPTERFEAPPVRGNNDTLHLRSICQASKHGFAWWPEEIMERVYRLESAPVDRAWWRAA